MPEHLKYYGYFDKIIFEGFNPGETKPLKIHKLIP